MKLSENQIKILNNAADQADGLVEPLPMLLRGGAKLATLKSLNNKALIEKNSDDQWVLTREGYQAIDRKPPTPPSLFDSTPTIDNDVTEEELTDDAEAQADVTEDAEDIVNETEDLENPTPEVECSVDEIADEENSQPAEEAPSAEASETANKTKSDKPKKAKTSKKATLAAMIEQPGGATIEALCEALEWEKHSVRGAISQLKSGGLDIVSTKTDNGRCYTIKTDTEENEDNDETESQPENMDSQESITEAQTEEEATAHV